MRERDRPLVMGILNVTPDSFYDGGRFASPEDAIEAALRMEADGADIVDVGGESTRPGATSIPTETELERVLPVIAGIRERTDLLIAIDTVKAAVARAALEAGASIVNDVSALRADEAMGRTIASARAFVVLMHMRGTPKTMQDDPTYDDVVEEIAAFLAGRLRAAADAGIAEDRVFVDPGIGFGKRLRHNLELLRHLERLVELGPPIVVGVSRKSFLGRLLDLPSDQRLEATIAADAVAVARGADVLRVHDVPEGRRTADVAFCLRRDVP